MGLIPHTALFLSAPPFHSQIRPTTAGLCGIGALPPLLYQIRCGNASVSVRFPFFLPIRDEDSREMLEIIFEYRVYDLGDIFGWGGISGAFQTAVNAGAENFASSAKKIEKIFNKAVEKSLKAYEEADGM